MGVSNGMSDVPASTFMVPSCIAPLKVSKASPLPWRTFAERENRDLDGPVELAVATAAFLASSEQSL